MKNWKILLSLILTASGLGFSQVSADDGILAGAFLRMGLGARANAMGGAFTAVAEGPEAAYYNAGGVPFISKRQIALEYRFLSLDRNFNYIGFATGIRPKVEEGSREVALNGGLALSWIHAGVDEIDGRDFAGNHYQNFSNAENAFALSFGVMPLDILAVGFTAKVLYNRFPNMGDKDATISDTGLGVDLGVLVKPLPYLSLGLVVKEINAKYNWKTDKVWEKDIDKIDRFPTTYRAGIACRYPYPWLLLAVDVEKNNQQDWKYFVGTEALFQNKFAIRAGVNNGSPTLGGGYQFQLFARPVQIQYAFITEKYDVASEHIFSWHFQF
ncbi:MAG: hypothetical protein ONB16_13450 [candidate division KSB1 bacterium]|nr:hypothetical protein [candidate division KSB1 bacterium]MDZ7318454.1 hypothetical protein [candidate division KSB1 bacterium]MDZ7340076.1 hypothetical protein [candidate division KSB1 bacterium]